MNLLNTQLRTILSKNESIVCQKFIAKLTTDMSSADGEGHVYGYIPRGAPFKKTNFKMKLGRTQKFNPEDRVAEWGGKLVFSVRTVCNRKLERLVHLLFDAWNIDVFNEETQKNEIEWFHFTEKVHVATLANMINDIMSDMHMEDESDSDTNVKVPIIVTHVRSKSGFLTSGKININTATHQELTRLTGIADKLAIRILDYRESRRFNSIEDIMNVPYIKDGVFAKCKHQLCV